MSPTAVISSTTPTTFSWSIANFAKLESERSLCSPIFEHNGKRFYIGMSPPGVALSNGGWSVSHVQFYIWLYSDHTNVKLKYEMALLKRDKSKWNAQDGLVCFTNNKNMLHSWNYSISRAYLLDPANSLIKSDALTIQCQIEPSSAGSPKAAVNQNKSTLSLSCFVGGDIILTVSGRELGAHRALLAAHSPLFAEMFAKAPSQVLFPLEDVKPEVVELILLFIYKKCTEKMDKYAVDLLKAARKFQLASLKSLCEKYLLESITAESVSSYLLFAYNAKYETLQSRCVDYFIEHSSKVMATEGWKKVKAAKPALGFFMLEKMALKVKK